jgi:hypothetical protein
MRERELIRLRAQTLARAHGITNTRRLKGRKRIAYRYLLHGLRLLSAWAKEYAVKT